MRRLKSIICDEGGSELVEFAVAAAVYFTVLIGVFEFCLVIYTGGFVAYAAQQGTRYAMVRGGDWTSACPSSTSFGCKILLGDGNVQTYILSLPHPGINLTASNIVYTPLSTTATGAACTPYAQGCRVKVTVSYSFSLHIPYVPTAAIPLHSTSIETIQN